jgi:tetratricopeptide (TPR) repeat protein
MLGKYSEGFELFSKTYNNYHYIYAEEKAHSRLGQAESLRMLGNYDRASEWYQEVEWVAREKNNLRLLGRVLRSSAELLRVQGNPDALLALEEIKRLSETEETSYLFGRLYYLLILGGYYLNEDLDHASSLFEQAQGLAKNGEFCLKAEYAHSLFGLAEAKRLGRDTDKAKDLYSVAHFLYNRMGIKWGQVRKTIALTLISAGSKCDFPMELEGTDAELVRMFINNTLQQDKQLFLNIP